MSGSSFFTILILTLLIALASAEAHAQTGSSRFGPVVNAYLTGLEEELDELEFQLEHKEIARADYDLAKRRLHIVRRFVEAYAAANNEDHVPEFQVLTDDELLMLGLKTRPDPGTLAEGQVLDNQWRLTSIERGKPRFLVFVHLPRALKNRSSRDAAKIDPSEVIETIIVPERPPFVARPRTASRPSRAEPQVGTASETPLEAPTAPDWKSPQIMFIYLPQYTDRARNSGTVGDVIVSATFQADGRVADVKLEKGLGMGLDQRSLDAVRRIGFIPGRRNGVDVDTAVQVIFTFSQGKVNFHVKSPDESSMTPQQRGQGQ